MKIKFGKLLRFKELVMLLGGLALLVFSTPVLRWFDPAVHVWGMEPIQNIFLAMFYLTMSTVMARVLTRVNLKYFTERGEQEHLHVHLYRRKKVSKQVEDINEDELIDDPWEQRVSLRLYSLYFCASIVILVFTL